MFSRWMCSCRKVSRTRHVIEASTCVPLEREGDFGLVDVAGGKLVGSQKLERELTVRAGEVCLGSERNLGARVEREFLILAAPQRSQ